MISIVTLFVLCNTHHINSNPIILKESSPSGESVVAISSSDPNFEKYLSFNFPAASRAVSRSDSVESAAPEDLFKRSYSFAAPGQSAAGSGRSFVSTSNFNPFLLPIFNWPINLEGLGLSNFGLSNWFKGAEGFYEPAFAGNGEVKSVTAVNDNGHVYGKVKTITFDNKDNI